MIILVVNSDAAVCISDSTPYEVDPWELNAAVEEVVEETIAGSSSFSA